MIREVLLTELKYIAKNTNINGYKSMPNNKLLGMIDKKNNNNNNNNKSDTRSPFKSKKGLYKPTRNSIFKLKREKIKKSFYKPARKNLFKSKIEKNQRNLLIMSRTRFRVNPHLVFA